MSQKTILVVDDEVLIGEIVKRGLSNEYNIINVTSGEKGLEIIPDKKPDLILLDIMMPKYNGIEICRKIRELTDTPIVMITALEDITGQIVDSAMKAGANDFMHKPFTADDIRQRIIKYI